MSTKIKLNAIGTLKWANLDGNEASLLFTLTIEKGVWGWQSLHKQTPNAFLFNYIRSACYVFQRYSPLLIAL